MSSTHQTICFLGGESLALGVGLLQPPAVDLPDEGGVGVLLAEVLDRAEEVADAVVGQARLVAAVGQLHQAVVDDQRDPAGVGHAVAAGGRRRTAHAPALKVASTWSSRLFGNALILCQDVRLRSMRAEAELGEVGQEDVGQVDHDRLAARG